MDAIMDPDTGTRTDALSKALAWFSIGLGLAELLAPAKVARLVGASEEEGGTTEVVRALGAREIISGVGILTQRAPETWMRARVAGDMMDLGLLATVLRQDEGDRGRTAAATAAVLGVTGLDLLSASRLNRTRSMAGGSAAHHSIAVDEAVTIARSPQDVYAFWRQFENLPRFMRHLESVRTTGDGRSHWIASAPAGLTAEWDAIITDDRPGELIAWRSDGGDLNQWGSVQFRPAPGNRGTEVRVRLRYHVTGGKFAALIAKLFHEEPSQQIRDDLRALKQVLETGEVIVSDATVRKGRQPAHPTKPQKGDYV